MYVFFPTRLDDHHPTPTVESGDVCIALSVHIFIRLFGHAPETSEVIVGLLPDVNILNLWDVASWQL